MNAHRPNRCGFTLIEVMIVGMMMVVLGLVLSSAWSGLGQPSIDALVRCRVQQEAQIAAASLAADCGGCPPVAQASIAGSATTDTFSGAIASGDALQLSFTSGAIITYSMDSDQHTLVRQAAGTSLVIASNVYGMTLDEDVARIKMTLTFQFRDTGPDKYRIPYSYVFHVPTVIQ